MNYFRQAEPEEVYNVALNMRERDFEEIDALRWSEGREELAQGLCNELGNFQNVFVCGDDDGPVAIVCYIPLRRGVWSLGLFATDSFQNIGSFLTKRIIREIIPALDHGGAHRVECQSIVGYDQVHAWLEFLGLREECLLKGFGKNGEDFKTFSWVRDEAGHYGWDRGEIVNVH